MWRLTLNCLRLAYVSKNSWNMSSTMRWGKCQVVMRGFQGDLWSCIVVYATLLIGANLLFFRHVAYMYLSFFKLCNLYVPCQKSLLTLLPKALLHLSCPLKMLFLYTSTAEESCALPPAKQLLIAATYLILYYHRINKLSMYI